MANLDTDTNHTTIPSRDQRGRVYDRPTGSKNNMAMIIGLILAAIAVVILLALLF